MSSYSAKLVTAIVPAIVAAIWFHPMVAGYFEKSLGADNMKGKAGVWFLMFIVFWGVVFGTLFLHEHVFAQDVNWF
jgi:hypothetical protein